MSDLRLSLQYFEVVTPKNNHILNSVDITRPRTRSRAGWGPLLLAVGTIDARPSENYEHLIDLIQQNITLCLSTFMLCQKRAVQITTIVDWV